jgi:hypothetical protein
MKNTLNLSRNSEVLHALSALPEKMLRLHGTENVSEFVLYELCHKNCFNLPKAAFFVDNPDFNCFKGVAGFNKKEHEETVSLWDDPEAFTHFMANNNFNKQVRSINQCSGQAKQQAHEKLLADIAHQLDVRDLGYHRFPLKHGNNGFIMYDKHEVDMNDLEMVSRGACLLGFCPIF